MSILLVSGTGTDVGKTVVTAGLTALALSEGRDVAVLKPAQTGIDTSAATDTETIARLVGGNFTRHELARYPEPLAPNTAARRSGLPPVRVADVVAEARRLATTHDLVLIEGAGGVMARFDDLGANLTDVAVALDAPVLVVTQPALGTLNVTELTAEVLRHRGVVLRGLVLGTWPVAPDLAMRCNVADLPLVSGAPLLGAFPEGAGRLEPAEFTRTARGALVPEFGGTWDLEAFATANAPPAPPAT